MLRSEVRWFPRFLLICQSHLKWAMNPEDMNYEAMQQILRCEGRCEVMTFLNSYKETAGIGTPVGTSTPAATVAGVGTFTTRNIPGRSVTPPGQGYLTAAQRGKRPAVGRKTPRSRPTTGGKPPRRVPRQPTPSSPSDPGSRRRSSVGSSNGGRRGGGGGGGGDDDYDDDDDEDDTPSSLAGPSIRRRRADRLLNDAEMQQRLQQLLEDQRQTAAGRRIAGITTTNTITTTYKNGQRPKVTRNSMSVGN